MNRKFWHLHYLGIWVTVACLLAYMGPPSLPMDINELIGHWGALLTDNLPLRAQDKTSVLVANWQRSNP